MREFPTARRPIAAPDLADQLIDDLAAGLGKLLKPAAMEISQLAIVQAEQAQQRNMQVFNRMNDLDRLIPRSRR